MRFVALVIPKDYGNVAANTLPDEAAMAAMGRFNEELVKAGVLLTAEGLHPPAAGTRVIHTVGQRKPEVMDGPFTESRELVGGFWILDVKNKQEAIEWMKRAPFFHDAIVEIRQVQEPEDFPPSEKIEREKRLGEKLKAARK